MPAPWTVSVVGESWSSLETAVRRVVTDAAEADGVPPLDEASELAMRHGRDTAAMWVTGDDADVTGFAWLHDGSLDLVVRPDARGAGRGRALLEEAMSTNVGPVTAWSHGNHPAAGALAEVAGFRRVRDLWVMRRSLHDLPPAQETDGIDIRSFRVGEDEDAWLALNAESFAQHPEQGRVTRADLDERIGEPWFDPAGFFLAWRGEDLVGFHWTKVHDQHPPVGEVYVVGVSPSAQGGGLGRLLTLTGLHHLADRGLDQVLLYVESDNLPAVAVYERLGFTHAAQDTHVQYALPEVEGGA